ncbi:MAG TPA: alpha/beta hydrolase [Acidimicrobiales bacterium]
MTAGEPHRIGRPRLRTTLVALGLVAAVLAAVLPGCDWPDGTRFVDTVFTEVDVTRDVVYRRTTDHQGQPVELRLDIYQPRGDTLTRRPAVVWMFGGAWIAGERSQMAGYAEDSARRGYVGVTIDYRIRPGSGGGDFLDAAMDAYDDAVAAVEWLKANAATYRIDARAIVAAGYSAGGINALNLLYLPGSRGPATSPVAGAVGVAGLSFATPTADDPPALMFNGTNDQIVPYDSARRTCSDARRVGAVCRFTPIEGAGHEIAFTQRAAIQEQTGDFVFEHVLIPLGYRANQPPPS